MTVKTFQTRRYGPPSGPVAFEADGVLCYNSRKMTYALRKLIAFVFLGGMFWFIYQDLDNLDKPWFMHALGLLTIAFAFFWLLIPMVVVWVRRVRRVRNNRARHAKWLVEGGAANIRPRPADRGKTASLASIGKGEVTYFHEKGTLYTEFGAPGVDPSKYRGRPLSRPSDVAFPGFRRRCHVDQRTHCYFTGGGVAFAGKELDFSIPYGELAAFSVEPGGIVFEANRGPLAARFAFTFQNPLIAADVLRFAEKEGR